MDRSANARTERGASPRTRTAAAQTHRAREKAVRGGRGTGIPAGASRTRLQRNSRPSVNSTKNRFNGRMRRGPSLSSSAPV